MQKLTVALADILGTEHVVGEETLFYLHTVFGIEDHLEAGQLLTDNDSFACQSLLELIFSPDLKQRKKVEQLIDRPLTKRETEQIRSTILKQRIKTRIVFPRENRQPAYFTYLLEKPVTNLFLDKLHLDYPLPFHLKAKLLKIFSNETVIELMALLRQKRLHLEEESVNILYLFLTSYPDEDNDFWQYVHFILWILEQGPQDILSFLQGLREQLLHQLEGNSCLQDLLKRFPVEMLLSQKISLSIEPPEHLLDQLHMTELLLSSLAETGYRGKAPG